MRLRGMFRNLWGYFNETWCEDTFGQYAQSFFLFSRFDLFCGLQAAGFVQVLESLRKFWEIGQGVFQDLKSLGKPGFVIMAMEQLWKFMSLL
jgi:hypothetical protein